MVVLQEESNNLLLEISIHQATIPPLFHPSSELLFHPGLLDRAGFSVLLPKVG
jgi:hypothetical protein